MNRQKKILSGIFALVIGLSVVMPLRASADERDHHRDGHAEHHEWRGDRHEWRGDRDRDRDDQARRWRWDRYEDHQRAYPYAPGYAYGQRGYLPSNGEGMINHRNPNLFWACDSDGHHCHWASRY
jgi:hypothetical protein